MLKKPKNQEFYANLMNGTLSRGMLGLSGRFNAQKVLKNPSIEGFFVTEVSPLISKNDTVLDLGCGTGIFAVTLAKLANNVIAVDVVEEFVNSTSKLVAEHQVNNVKVLFQSNNKIPLENNTVDAVVMVDVLHHVENVTVVLQEVKRVLKPGGQLLIFEPNKLNPLIYLIHLFDINEWGLLALGRPGIYRKKLSSLFQVEEISFSGLVVGPTSPIFQFIAKFLSSPFISPFGGWLLPKIFLRVNA